MVDLYKVFGLDYIRILCHYINMKNAMEKDMNFENALTELHRSIVTDFARKYSEDDDQTRVIDFAESIEFEEGRKYIKVTKKLGNQTMVWGFIVKGDNDKLFREGDILKAASWAAPARNKPRGNILRGDFSWVRWTGPQYLQ